MKFVFPIAFFGLVLGGCVNIDARLPEVEHADWVEERRNERLSEADAPAVIPLEHGHDEALEEMSRYRALMQQRRAQIDAAMENAGTAENGSAEEFREEGRQQTEPPNLN